MTRTVFAIRPEPGLTATMEGGRALGLKMAGEALFAIEPVAWDAPDPAGFDGVLLGSANAVRHFGPALSDWVGKPAYVVGEATAQAARAAGLDVALVGAGYLQGVADRLSGGTYALLRVTGRDHVPLEPPTGIRVETRVAYDSVTIPMSDSFAAQLRGGGVVLLHSAVAARHFAAECGRLSVDLGNLALAALGARIAAAAGPGWQACRLAQSPRESDLLALAQDMCH